MSDFITQIDTNILLFIQEHLRFYLLTLFFVVFTNLEWSGALSIILSVVFLFFKKTRIMGILCAVSLAITFVINNLILKNLVGRIRPYEVIDRLELLVKPETDFSFPSGHTASAFAVFMVIFLVAGRKWTEMQFEYEATKRNNIIRGVAMAFPILMAYSRIYVGVHYPSDVIAATIIAVTIAVSTVEVYKKLHRNRIQKAADSE